MHDFGYNQILRKKCFNFEENFIKLILNKNFFKGEIEQKKDNKV